MVSLYPEQRQQKAGTYVFKVATGGAATQAAAGAGTKDFSTASDVSTEDLSINGVKLTLVE